MNIDFALVLCCINAVTYLYSRSLGECLRRFDFVEQDIQIVSGKFPFERFGELFIVELETRYPFFSVSKDLKSLITRALRLRIEK